MILELLLCLPFFGAIAAWIIRSNDFRRLLLVGVAFCELLLALSCWIYPPEPIGHLLIMDDIGRLVLTVTCTLFFAASVYGVGYLRGEGHQKRRRDFFQGFMFGNAPEAIFTGCLLLFLASAVLVTIAQHFGLLWIGIETTTLVSAPLIYFHRHRRSLEATWKYLMICSVGIALALVGNLLLDIAMQTGGEKHAIDMTLGNLLELAPEAHKGWFKAAFVFLLIGYGTKMGLAPMHTWLPDAHSEAPSLVSALLSGALLNCAFLGIFRSYQVSLAAGLGEMTSVLLMAFGFVSLLTATVFILGQTDFKRMLAYSSVEHMGILLLGLGIAYHVLASHPEAAQYGTRVSQAFGIHMMGHSFVKAALFMLAGNILAKYKTKNCLEVTGLCKTLPITGALWLTGILAITGSPPFALFISEFSILQGLLSNQMYWQAAAYLTMLGIIFVGMFSPTLHMYRGRATQGLVPEKHENFWLTLPPLGLLALALALGVFMPSWLNESLASITRLLH